MTSALLTMASPGLPHGRCALLVVPANLPPGAASPSPPRCAGWCRSALGAVLVRGQPPLAVLLHGEPRRPDRLVVAHLRLARRDDAAPRQQQRDAVVEVAHRERLAGDQAALVRALEALRHERTDLVAARAHDAGQDHR